MFCQYYQAHVPRLTTNIFASILRSYEHLVFDRTIDKLQGTFEFFVSADLEPVFIEFMHEMMKRGLVSNLQKLSNRLNRADA